MYLASLLSMAPLLLAACGKNSQVDTVDSSHNYPDSCSRAQSPPDTIPPWLTHRLQKFGLQTCEFKSTGRGLQTTHNRSPGDVVISVPKSETLTVSWLLENFLILDQAVETSLRVFHTKLSDEQILSAGLLLLKESHNSGEEKIQPKYVQSLPSKQYSVLQMPNELLECLPSAYQRLIRAYQGRVDELHHTLSRCFKGDTSHGTYMRQVLESREKFNWAFASVRSRCVGMYAKKRSNMDDRIRTGAVENDEIRVMLPGFDLLNHKFAAETSHEFDTEQNVYVLRSNDSYSAGDQVFISYGDKRNNLKMLMTYGFCVDDNPDSLVVFDSFDLLHSCSEVRPHCFSLPILQEIRGLLEKLGKHRELYEYDGINQEPMFSLSSAIRMMGELEKQILQTKEDDPSFYEDVLSALLMSRRSQISKGLEIGEQIQQNYNANNDLTFSRGWIPMLGSIKTLLMRDMQCLTPASSQ